MFLRNHRLTTSTPLRDCAKAYTLETKPAYFSTKLHSLSTFKTSSIYTLSQQIEAKPLTFSTTLPFIFNEFHSLLQPKSDSFFKIYLKFYLKCLKVKNVTSTPT